MEVSYLFYETLSPFYSENMFGCASQKFTDMVDLGVRIEEWVRKGRGSKDGVSSGDSSGSLTSGSSNGNKKFGNGYPKKNTQEVGMVAHGGSQSVYPNYPYVANIPPLIPAPQNQNYQPQRPQIPPSYYPPLYQPQPYLPEVSFKPYHLLVCRTFHPCGSVLTEIAPFIKGHGDTTLNIVTLLKRQFKSRFIARIYPSLTMTLLLQTILCHPMGLLLTWLNIIRKLVLSPALRISKLCWFQYM